MILGEKGKNESREHNKVRGLQSRESAQNVSPLPLGEGWGEGFFILTLVEF
jgi:hypothetical protein